MKVEALSRGSIKAVNSIINNTLLVIILLLAAFAGYALWDSQQIHHAADKSNYAVYKPSVADEGKSFKELQDINPEVFAWLTVYGTNIDYPVTQGHDNMKYVNTNAEGQYSLSGAIFLDSNNSKDFSDFSNIVYGHHMAKNVMFGELDEFSDINKFETHKYGYLYFDGEEHGLEFFAFIHTDAYDYSVFNTFIDDDMRQEHLDGLLAKAIHMRDIGVTTQDRIVLLSTCSSTSTNGRDLLLGRVTDEVFEYTAEEENDGNDRIDYSGMVGSGGMIESIPTWALALIAILAAVLIVLFILIIYRNRKKAKEY